MVISDTSVEGSDTNQFHTLLEQGRVKEAKLLLRGLRSNDLSGVWRSILSVQCRNSPVDTASIYWDTVDTCFGSREVWHCANRTPSCVEAAHTPSYGLDEEARAQVCRLVTCLSYNSPDVPYCPLLFPSAAILRKYLSEEDCFSMLCMLVNPPKEFIYFTQSKRSWDVSVQSIKPLALKFIKKHLSNLERVCGQEQVELAITGWIWWIFEALPFKYLERILTSFLLEGHKVLYRAGLALLKLYSKQVCVLGSQASKDLATRGVVKDLPAFCRNLSIPVEEFLEVAFKISRFSRSEIQKTTLKIEMELKSRTSVRRKEGRRRSNEEMLTADTVDDIIAVSDTLSYKQLILLWHQIPERITMTIPKLVYSSNEHGTSLKTFFNSCEHYEPTILIIKTLKGEVFGAYCSTAWAVRNERDERGMKQRYFGTGESFLFKLAGDKLEKYGWVGEHAETEGRGDRAEQLFMSGDNTMVTVGGGDGTGIYLDENLEFGRTETCKTFRNPPLASENDFSVSVVEVFGFNSLD